MKNEMNKLTRQEFIAVMEAISESRTLHRQEAANARRVKNDGMQTFHESKLACLTAAAEKLEAVGFSF